MALILSRHMRDKNAERLVPLEWIELTVREPDWIAPCPKDAALTRSFRRIEAAGSRVLRVVHRPQGTDILVVTAFLDRDARP